ncbi:hypothetical protein [Phenylobacterium sp.]|uniref:hypothetical protein n=1 Tax=Phenylobacterium sp. TaxID=1871053 RepID=UPI00356A92A7
MPADVSFDNVSPSSLSIETTSTRRLPLGIGLVIAACASVGLWVAVAAAIRAFFF